MMSGPGVCSYRHHHYTERRMIYREKHKVLWRLHSLASLEKRPSNVRESARIVVEAWVGRRL